MSDTNPETKDGEQSAEKRLLSTVAKALCRSVQEVQPGAASLSREQRKENVTKAWTENRRAYLKEAKRVVKQLNLTAANLPPRTKKAGAAE